MSVDCLIGQETLFDLMPTETRATTEYDTALDDWALLYTATATGEHSGIHFMMTVEDAMTWCESNISHGVTMGIPWAYFWTSVKNFLSCYWMGESTTIDLTRATDNGKWDEKIAEMGLTKISIYKIPDILGPLGVTVIL